MKLLFLAMAAATTVIQPHQEILNEASTQVYKQLNLYPGSNVKDLVLVHQRLTGHGDHYVVIGKACYGGFRPCREDEYFNVTIQLGTRALPGSQPTKYAEVHVPAPLIAKNGGLKSNLCGTE